MSDDDTSLDVDNTDDIPVVRAPLPGTAALRGQRTLLTPQVHKDLVAAVAAGAPPGRAAAFVGIATRTYSDWMQRGMLEAERLAELHAAGENPGPDPREQVYLSLWEDVEQAKARAGVRNVANLQKVAAGGFVVEETVRSYVDSDGITHTEKSTRRAAPDWRAAAWWLERMDRENFGKTEVVDQTAQAVILAGVDLSALAARIGEAVAAHAEPAQPADVVDGDVDDTPEAPVTPAEIQQAITAHTSPRR